MEQTAVLDGVRVIEGEVLENGAVRFPEPPTEPGPSDVLFGEPLPKKPSAFKRLGRPVLVAAAVAGVLGLAVGSGATYLAVDRHDSHSQVQAAPQQQNSQQNGNGNGQGNGTGRQPGQRGGGGGAGGNGGLGNGLPGFPGFPGLPGGGGSGGNGNGQSTVAADLNSNIQLPIPSGWQGGTADDGTAFLTVGQYQCPGSTGGGAGGGGGTGGSGGGTGGSGGGTAQVCSLGGVNTAEIQGTDPQAAAKKDIQTAVDASYPGSKSHQELKSEAVTVDGRSGYLVRWQVTAAQGNNGTVESVVFPTADGKGLIAVRLGFDIAAKAPAVSQMDTIVSGISDYAAPAGSGSGGGNAAGGSNT
ncbi:hypothetical protein [Kitasatospora kifunensis]|uniref:Uncharacterized protein n=1 Tax=Kitasatospora kifunensis TaxID=58351 RepID=A0A7W7VU59_KITKI|nr:hypothetical protein [Kitasatospora kifunensis]MBB4922319.1 hypothetical protein [Kitasatospora kifunensis]